MEGNGRLPELGMELHQLSAYLMKGYPGLYYLFFVLLIMGGFAAMAQNRYGLYILAAVGILFGVLFLYQTISILGRKNVTNRNRAIEPACLSILSFLIILRLFYVHPPFIEIVFGVVLLVLIGFYGQRLAHSFHVFQPKHAGFAYYLVVFYAAIILYLVSIGSFLFWPNLSFYTGLVGFLLLLIIIIVGIASRKKIMDGEDFSFFRGLWRLSDNAVLVISLFFLFSLYAGFTRAGLLPKIYSDEYPQAYFEMMDQSAPGRTDKDQAKPDHELFKEKYEQFVRENIHKK